MQRKTRLQQSEGRSLPNQCPCHSYHYLPHFQMNLSQRCVIRPPLIAVYITCCKIDLSIAYLVIVSLFSLFTIHVLCWVINELQSFVVNIAMPAGAKAESYGCQEGYSQCQASAITSSSKGSYGSLYFMF